MSKKEKLLFNELTITLQNFIEEIKKVILSKKIYETWNSKDILCHITFWHINYSENLMALEENRVPPLLKGKYSEINDLCLKTMRVYSEDELIKKLKKAHEIIGKVVKHGKVKKMTYKKGSRDYSISELLDVVNGHIKEHSRDIVKAIVNTSRLKPR